MSLILFFQTGVLQMTEETTRDHPNAQWFVLHTLSGQERKAKESIEKRIQAEELEDLIFNALLGLAVRSGPFRGCFIRDICW